MGTGIEFCFKMLFFSSIYSSNFSEISLGTSPALLNISALVSCKAKTHVLKMRLGCSDNFSLYHLSQVTEYDIYQIDQVLRLDLLLYTHVNSLCWIVRLR